MLLSVSSWPQASPMCPGNPRKLRVCRPRGPTAWLTYSILSLQDVLMFSESDVIQVPTGILQAKDLYCPGTARTKPHSLGASGRNSLFPGPGARDPNPRCVQGRAASALEDGPSCVFVAPRGCWQSSVCSCKDPIYARTPLMLCPHMTCPLSQGHQAGLGLAHSSMTSF